MNDKIKEARNEIKGMIALGDAQSTFAEQCFDKALEVVSEEIMELKNEIRKIQHFNNNHQSAYKDLIHVGQIDKLLKEFLNKIEEAKENDKFR